MDSERSKLNLILNLLLWWTRDALLITLVLLWQLVSGNYSGGIGILLKSSMCIGTGRVAGWLANAGQNSAVGVHVLQACKTPLLVVGRIWMEGRYGWRLPSQDYAGVILFMLYFPFCYITTTTIKIIQCCQY